MLAGRSVFRRFAVVIVALWSGSVAGQRPEASESVNLSLGEIRDSIGSGDYGNIHSVVALRQGQLVVEWYFEGTDERLGSQLGVVDFDANTLHDLRSVTKSVVSLLFGMATGSGAAVGLDDPLNEHFPDYSDWLQPGHSSIRLRHLLSMTSGIRWDERTYPYTDPRNSETAMYLADDRLQLILSESIGAPAGERFNYSGGDVELIAAIIERATQTPLQQYARENLFQPLGIEQVEWIEYPGGGAAAASGLRMRPVDMVKIGQLVLQRGSWEGNQLVAESWITESTSFKTEVRGDGRCGRQYGFFWWLSAVCTEGRTIPYILGDGNGGQRLLIVPELEIVVATTAGYYNGNDSAADDVALAVLSEISRR